MTDDIFTASLLSIRESGLDEYWLQDQIYDNPSILGLGELEVVQRERIQSSGGKLDLLLKNPIDDSMYEVEIMLGVTDETHIIRTIEYWDIEKRRWPQRQHFAVIVAETITRRFFNVISLLSLSIPIIAIQASLLEANNIKILNFTKVLDLYEEPEEENLIDDETYDRTYWQRKSFWTIENAETLSNLITEVYPHTEINYVKNYIAISYNNNNHFIFHKRQASNSLLSFRIKNDSIEEVKNLLDEKNLSYIQKNQRFKINVDKGLITTNSEAFKTIAKLVKERWE